MTTLRRQNLSVILLWVVMVLCFVAAVVPWIHATTRGAAGSPLPPGGGASAATLAWQSNQPPEPVVMGLPAASLVLAALASSKPSIRSWVVLFAVPIAIVFAALVRVGDPMKSAVLRTGLATSAGYWVALTALGLTVVAGVLAVTSYSATPQAVANAETAKARRNA